MSLPGKFKRTLSARAICSISLMPLIGLGMTACSPVPAKPSAAAEAPASPLAVKMVRCIEDAGWEAEVGWNGVVTSPEMPPEQLDLWTEVADACQKETGFGDLARLTPSQVAELYRQEVAEFECLTAQGFTPSQPPSEQVYIDTFRSADQYYAIKGITATPELMRLCPAPTWFLNLEGFD